MSALPGSPGWTRFLRTAVRRGGAPALIVGGRAAGFAMLRHLAVAQATAGPLAGVAPGERVLLWSRNSVAMAAAILATWARGAIPVLLAPQTAERHVAHAAATTDVARVLAEPALLDAARRAATGRTIAVLEEEAVPADASGQAAAEAAHVGEPASILFTSGSSGLPKGVAQSHAALAEGCRSVAQVLGLRAEDRILCGVPWGFDYGWGQLLSTFFLGTTQILPSASDPLAVCEAITRDRPSVLAAVPSLLAGMLRGVSDIARAELSSLRLLTSTGSRIAPALFAETQARFGHAAISLNYGLTETYRSASLDPALARTHPDSVGRAIPGVALAVVDEAGRPVPPGTVGEVVHRGVGVFLGYWGDPEATARVRRPDPLWRHPGLPAPPAVFTGDLGAIGPDGLLRLAGRRDRQIKSMGVRVSPEEIEGILLGSDLLRDAAVIARPDETIGEVVVAVVVPTHPGEDPLPALKRRAREEMSPFMQPRAWHVVDTLPRTASGKVDYPVLRRRFGAAAAEAEPR
jgi:acyl-CoA synthetase (AMP-forming)/AMP-acid ligase II